MHENGNGVTTDFGEALNLYHMAANHGDLGSIYILANMYQYGTGVNADPDRAMKLYLQAASLGQPNAIKKLAELAAAYAK